jgi:hypothetical protein
MALPGLVGLGPTYYRLVDGDELWHYGPHHPINRIRK